MIDFLQEHLGQSAEEIKKKASMRATENLSTGAKKKLAKGLKKRVADKQVEIEEEEKVRADRADGYGQLIEEGDEETKELIAARDDDGIDNDESSKFGES